jgi:hypothetical protein
VLEETVESQEVEVSVQKPMVVEEAPQTLMEAQRLTRASERRSLQQEKMHPGID